MDKKENPNDYLSIKEASLRLGVSVGTLYNWIRRGRLAFATTPGGAKRVSESAIRRIIC